MDTSKDRVDIVRPEVEYHLPEWKKVRDVVGGERKVKEAKFTYLPKINPTDKSDDNAERNKQYIFRAYFFNGTGRTLEGLTGIAFSRNPDAEMPAAMDSLKTDVDGSGRSLNNQAHGTLEEVLITGRCGLYVDYPRNEKAVSMAEQQAENIHAMILQYQAEQIINWRIGQNRLPELIVLAEQKKQEGDYATKYIPQWRELRMVGGEFQIKVWSQPDGAEAPVLDEEYTPTKGDGTTWGHIPFYFVGAMDNDAEIDKAPLLDLSNANLAHYRSSANHFDAEYYVNQPQYWVVGADDAWVKQMKKDGIYFGSRAIGSVPPNGDVKLLQPSETTMASSSMDRLKQDMVSLGARLLTPGEAVKTRDQAKADIASSYSVLSLSAENVSEAYTYALQDAAQFMRVSGEIKFSVQSEFAGLMADPALIKALVESWQAGAWPDSDHYAMMRKLGTIDPAKTDEDIEAELEEQENQNPPIVFDESGAAPPQPPPEDE